MFFTKQFVSALVALAIGMALSGTVLAQTPAPAATPPAAEPAKPEPDWTFTSNIGLYSQYVFRGVSKPTRSPRCRAGSTSATRAASTSARGRRTSAGSRIPRPASRPAWNGTGTADTRAACRPTSATTSASSTTGTRARTRPGFTKPDTTELYGALYVEVALAQVQLEREQQDIRHPRFARQQLPRPHRELRRRRQGQRRDRQGHAVRPSRPPVVLGQSRQLLQQQLQLRRLEGRRVDRGLRGHRRHLRLGHQRQDQYYTNSFGKNISANQFVGFVQKTF